MSETMRIHIIILQHGSHGYACDMNEIASCLYEYHLISRDGDKETIDYFLNHKWLNYRDCFSDTESFKEYTVSNDNAPPPCGKRPSVLAPDSFIRASKTRLHEVYYIHSSSYNSQQLKILLDQDDSLLIISPNVNEGRLTDDGVIHCSKRLSAEILPFFEELLKLYPPYAISVSCIGYSMGGLILRDSILRWQNSLPLEIEWKVFCTIGTPHVGIQHSPVASLAHGLAMIKGSSSYADMLLKNRTLSLKLISNQHLKALQRFNRRIVISSACDIFVPLYSSSLCLVSQKEIESYLPFMNQIGSRFNPFSYFNVQPTLKNDKKNKELKKWQENSHSRDILLDNANLSISRLHLKSHLFTPFSWKFFQTETLSNKSSTDIPKLSHFMENMSESHNICKENQNDLPPFAFNFTHLLLNSLENSHSTSSSQPGKAPTSLFPLTFAKEKDFIQETSIVWHLLSLGNSSVGTSEGNNSLFPLWESYVIVPSALFYQWHWTNQLSKSKLSASLLQDYWKGAINIILKQHFVLALAKQINVPHNFCLIQQFIASLVLRNTELSNKGKWINK